MYGERVTKLAPRFVRTVADVLFTGNRATIDAIRTAPPPSPLAPVDLRDPVVVHSVLDLAGRIGDLLLSAGTGNSDTKAQLRGIMSAYGLYNTHVDITLNTVTLYAQFDPSRNPASNFRVVKSLSTDFSRLTEVDRLIRSIIAGATPLELAQKILYDIETSPLPYRNRYALGAWGLFAASIALLLGGGWAVAAVAFVTTIFTVFANAWLASKSLPLFFQNFLGGFVAVLPTAAIYELARDTSLYFPPSLVIASCIVALLAGLTLVQALQDAVTGAPVTASARFFETLLSTGAIIAGIGAGLTAIASAGVILPPLDTSQTAGILGGTTVQIVAGALATLSFCVSCFTERRSMVVASTTALVASVAYYSVLGLATANGLLAAAVSSVLVGLAGGLLSRRYLIPPQITATAGITPFLPGLALYRGMSSILSDQFVVGISNLALALGTATTLAAGVVLGEWTARRLRRPRIIHRYKQLRRPRVARPRAVRRLARPGQAIQPLHWRRRQRKGTQSQWRLDELAQPDAPGEQ
ncbi:amino acid export carrier protein [Corynebacterium heidelbergense]|uniref:Amino acid export carrier protein n=1 Tax=Corynebacterium heidelbergense TaxID=2055947 RepID=A0A364V412_9CORY|nr:amino acid export carrier protein [Corynebacterium heidelbergense]